MQTFSALLTLCAANSPFTSEFPAQRSVTRSFDIFFDRRLNKLLSKQSRGWWFETPSRPLWRHFNDIYRLYVYWNYVGALPYTTPSLYIFRRGYGLSFISFSTSENVGNVQIKRTWCISCSQKYLEASWDKSYFSEIVVRISPVAMGNTVHA